MVILTEIFHWIINIIIILFQFHFVHLSPLNFNCVPTMTLCATKPHEKHEKKMHNFFPIFGRFVDLQGPSRVGLLVLVSLQTRNCVYITNTT